MNWVSYNSLVDRIFKRKNVILINFSYLSLLQLINLLLPLLTYPYLIRILGSDLFGLVVFAQGIVAFFQIAINFGFDVSATRRVSINCNDKRKISEVFFSVFISKSVLFIFSFLIFLIIIVNVEKYEAEKLLYLFSFLICFNELLFPIWYYQGIQKMKYITIINLISKLFYVLFIFVFVKNKSDYLIVPLLYGISAIIGGIFSIFIILKKDKIPLSLPRFATIKEYFIESVPFFFSRSASVFNAKINTVLIGSFLGFSEVAYYDLGHKLISVLQTPFMLLSQSLYPNVAKSKNMNLVRKLIKFVLGGGLIILIFVMLFSDIIVTIVGGKDMIEASSIFKIMSIYIPIVGISYLFGASTLVVNGYSKEYNMSVVYSFFFFVGMTLMCYALNMFNLYTFALLFVLPEFFIAAFRTRIVIQRKIFK